MKFVIPDARTKMWGAGDEIDQKGKGKVGEEVVKKSRMAKVNFVVRPLAWHVPLAINSKMPHNHNVGPAIRHNVPAKGVGSSIKVGPPKTAG